MKDLCKRKDLSYLTFEGRLGFLTEDVCRLVTIINNQRIYNYTKKIYQDRIKEEYLRLREGEDYLELKGADLVKFQLENPSVKVRKRKSLKFWFDSSVEKIRTYKSLEDEERDIEKLKSPYFYKSNLTRDLSNFSTRRYTFQNNQVQFLYKEISELKNGYSRLNLRFLYLESEIQILKVNERNSLELSNLIREYLLMKKNI